ncbi:MAG: hypothetical protein EAY65_03535 [Alphaproteobacteria bacterium]|nr:MAG: hypothetical protein EAY65_03535 [Alphaproteobacteria bacterium]
MPLPIRYIVLCVFLLIGSGGALAIVAQKDVEPTNLEVQADQSSKPRENVNPKRFIVYYGAEAKEEQFYPYDIIVFDRDKHPSLQKLRRKNKVLLGYISGGELEQYRDNFEQLKTKFDILGTNETWKDHMIVDVRDPEWTRHLIEDIIPPIVKQGFNGIFIDTLDSVTHYETIDPKRYKGMIQATATMIKTIHYHYPELKIMINRGFDVLPFIANDIHYVLAESTLVQYDFTNHTTKLMDDAIYQHYVQRMFDLKKQAPHLEMTTLDYWKMDDTAMVQELYRRHEANGFMPYVTTIELNRVDNRPQ